MLPSPRRFWSAWKVVGVSLLVLAVVVTSFLGWQYWLFSGGIFRTSTFDIAEWKALNKGTGDSSCYRGGMADDIKTRVLYAGMPKANVEALLGAPSKVRDGAFEYLLGMCSGFRIDFDTLDVHFDSNDQLKTTRIVQH